MKPYCNYWQWHTWDCSSKIHPFHHTRDTLSLEDFPLNLFNSFNIFQADFDKPTISLPKMFQQKLNSGKSISHRENGCETNSYQHQKHFRLTKRCKHGRIPNEDGQLCFQCFLRCIFIRLNILFCIFMIHKQW